MIFVNRDSISVPEIYLAERNLVEKELLWDETKRSLEKHESEGAATRPRSYELAGRLKASSGLGIGYAGVLSSAALPSLMQLFHGKCAYCETPFHEAHVDLELYRPRSGARALDGHVDPMHYFWLAYEWQNTLIACALCNRAKGTRFPVQSNRVRIGEADPDALLAEQPLLLDPCHDYPILHLTPEESGLLTPQSERGHLTIEVLNLNRSDLVERRREAWQLTQADVKSALRGEAREPGSAASRIASLLQPGLPFLFPRAMATRKLLEADSSQLVGDSALREFLRHAIPPLMAGPPEPEGAERERDVAEVPPSEAARPASPVPPEPAAQAPVFAPPSPPASAPLPASPPRKSGFNLDWLMDMFRSPGTAAPPPSAGASPMEKAVPELPAAAPEPSAGIRESADGKSVWVGGVRLPKKSYSIEDEDHQTRIAYFTSAKRMERFTIRNFKAIAEIQLDFPHPEADAESWLMVLGENGCGKSSILQALALTLMGQEHANALGLDARRFVRRDPDVKAGEVVVELSGVGTIRLEFTLDSPQFRVDPPDPKVLLLGYGATRLLPKMVGRESSTRKAVRILNLFDPTAPLADTESWLLDRTRVNEDQFHTFEEDVARLLMLPEGTRLYRENGQIEMDYNGRRKALRDMSDGYQSIIALAGDISTGVSDWWGGLREAEGIVLLDEIEVHLHPTWKISIVDRLRQTCPHLSFVVTTHDPLCLKGLRSEEIVVLRKTEEREVEVIRDIPNIEHLRADQLLGSFLFNLPSTRGSGVSVAIARYSQLLGKESRSAEEERELAMLNEQLDIQLSSALTPVQKTVEKALRAALAPQAIAATEGATNLEVLRQVRELLAEEGPA